MPIMVEREKWILYKHTCDYELIKAVALDVKNSCASHINDTERHRMQDRLAALDLYHTRNPRQRPLDSINHRINTLEFYMFGYEEKSGTGKRFIFSPLGNLFLNYINDEDKLKKIFATMLFGIQFQHPANGTPASFQLYPFRLVFMLLTDPRLGGRLHYAEFVYFLPFIHTITPGTYNQLVEQILEFRKLSDETVAELLLEDEHTYVNCVYEWQYYTSNLLAQAGILDRESGESIVKLYHPQKPTSNSDPTGRTLNNGYVKICPDMERYIGALLKAYPFNEKPVLLSDSGRLQLDCVKEVYSFYPSLLAKEIGEQDEFQVRLLELPKLIEKYSNNPENEAAYEFENVLGEGFNMFYNVEAKNLGGAGHTDIECLYLTKKKKFAVEAKSTANKLIQINAGRLREHREEIGGEYTIVITPRYLPAVKRDIQGTPIVILLANTFSEYLYNHVYHDVRDIDYADFDDIIIGHLGQDISKFVSDKTMEKFATR